jgi:predicted oxidoreductase
MWRLAEDGRTAADAARLVHAALDAGITLLDTADIYGFDGTGGFGDAEALLGEVLAAEPGLRARMVLATKGGILPPLPYDQSAAYLNAAIDASLRRLRTDVIDLWQVHRPDILAHPLEVARVLDDAVAAGKIRSLGVSNFTIHQIAALQHFLGHKLVATQPEISPLRIACFENGELDQAMTMGLVPLAWSPLGGDAWPRADERARRRRRARQGRQGARRVAHGRGLCLVDGPSRRIVPIVGSQQADRIREAAQAAHVRWTREEWYAVLVAARGETALKGSAEEARQ